MPTYTNVQDVTLNAVPIPGVKSITISDTVERLDSMADGARGPSMVGEGARQVTFSLELEAQASLPAIKGLANAGSLVFKEQLDSTASTLKTNTITNMVCLEIGKSSDQSNPNGVTASGESVGQDSVWSEV